MIRLIIQETDIGDAAHVGGPVVVRYRTFDVDLPDVEAVLRDGASTRVWGHTTLVGAELLPEARAQGGAP